MAQTEKEGQDESDEPSAAAAAAGEIGRKELSTQPLCTIVKGEGGGGGSEEEEVVESEGRKREKRKRKKPEENNHNITENEEEGEEAKFRKDPLVVLGSDIMSIILGYLDARSVALSLLVSRGWLGVASTDKLWKTKCEELWHGKAHIPRMSQLHGLSKLAAYSLSIRDSKRTRIRKEDLCDHAWEYRFTEAAPEYWRNLDPFWNRSGPPMRRYFHPDGSITADPDDKVWGGHESCYSVVTSLLSDGKIRKHYVRINCWPQMTVSRKEDWRWEMSNEMCCYSSIPDADKKAGTGPLQLGY